jgi:hypothetical protein
MKGLLPIPCDKELYLEYSFFALLGDRIAVKLAYQALNDTSLAGLHISAWTFKQILARFDQTAIDAHIFGRIGHFEKQCK